MHVCTVSDVLCAYKPDTTAFSTPFPGWSLSGSPIKVNASRRVELNVLPLPAHEQALQVVRRQRHAVRGASANSRGFKIDAVRWTPYRALLQQSSYSSRCIDRTLTCGNIVDPWLSPVEGVSEVRVPFAVNTCGFDI